MSSGEVRGAASAIPSAAARDALLQAYHSGFSVTLNHLMEIGGVVALVGAISAFALVRQRDFVIPIAPGSPPASGPGGQAPGNADGKAAEQRRLRWACLRRMLEPFTLEGRFVRLEPLGEDHIPGLVDAAAEDRTNYQWTYTPDGLTQMTEYVRDALEKVDAGAHVAFATIRKGVGRDDGDGDGDVVVGATRFCEIAFWQWPPGATHQRRRRSRRGGHRLHLVVGLCPALTGQHRGQALDDDATRSRCGRCTAWHCRPTCVTSDHGPPSNGSADSSTASCEPTAPARTTPCERPPGSPSSPRSGRP